MSGLVSQAGSLSGVQLSVDNMLQSLPSNLGQLRVENLQAELAEDAELVLIDVRTAGEIAASGKLEGAVDIPLEQMLEMREEWPPRDADIVVYDADGYRGNLAMTTLRAYGYRNVRNLRGGLTAWEEEGFAVATE